MLTQDCIHPVSMAGGAGRSFAQGPGTMVAFMSQTSPGRTRGPQGALCQTSRPPAARAERHRTCRLHHSSVMFLPNKVLVTDSICSDIQKIAYGLDMVF